MKKKREPLKRTDIIISVKKTFLDGRAQETITWVTHLGRSIWKYSKVIKDDENEESREMVLEGKVVIMTFNKINKTYSVRLYDAPMLRNALEEIKNFFRRTFKF
jgi:hypothetical protein